MSISLFVFPLILISVIFGFFEEYIIMFLILILHEAAHLLAIKKRQIEITKIKIEPFGMRITLKDNLISSSSDEIAVALAGPLISIISGCIFLILNYFYTTKHVEFFAYGNLYMGIFNLLPALPLDGGRILKAYLTDKNGYLKSYNTLKRYTFCISVLLIIFGFIIIYVTKFNFSVCITGVFLLFGILTEKNHFSYYMNKEISRYKTKSEEFERMPITRIAVNENYPVRKIFSELSAGKYCIVEVIKGNKKTVEFTEGELIEGMLQKGSDIKIKNIYKSS